MTLDELKPTLLSLIPDVTAPAMTLDEIVNTIRRRLTEGKALAEYVNQAEERHSAVLASLCEALDMPLHGATRVRDKIKTLRNELTETRDGLADRVSELDAIKDALSLSPATPASEVVAKIKSLRAAREWLATVNHQAMAKVLNLTSGMTSDEVARKIVKEVSFLRGQVDGLRGIAVKHRENLLTLLCEDPNRAKTVTTDEVVNLIQSKIAALALNLSLPETATWNMIMERIQHLAPSSLILHDLVSALGTTKAMDANEAMRRATDKIRYAQKQTSRLIKILGDGEAQDLHGAVDKILNMLTNMRPSLLLHKELASVLYLPEHASVNEAMRRATDKIKALLDLLNF